KTADWIIDLGPEAGAQGGRIVAEGTPEAVTETPGSITGAILRDVLANGPRAERPRFDPKAAAKAAIEEARRARQALGTLAEAKNPWEVDGRAWHTRDRRTRSGRPVRWDGAILERI